MRRAADAVWAVAHADGGDVESGDSVGVPPVGGGEEVGLFVPLERLDEFMDVGVEEGAVLGHGRMVVGSKMAVGCVYADCF